ncbi:MAG: hypothetical protein IT258_02400 [Saprospiraceae bacterium]|nr:hypothetical protein [Saprospiraceae bacterium]
MKQPDFFRLFAEKMQSATPPPDISGGDWQALQGRLDAHDRKRNRVLPLGWLFGLTGLLLLSNLGWFLLWQKTDDDVAALRSELPQKASDAVVLHDTVYKQLVVYQYDTIYRTVVVKRVEQGILAQTMASQNGTNPAFSTTNSTAQPTATSGQARQTPNGFATQDQATATSAATEKLANGLPFLNETIGQMATPNELPGLEIGLFPWSARLPILPPADDQMTPVKQGATAFPLIPQSFTLGIGAGGLNPVSKSLASTEGMSASVSAEIGFSKQLAMNLEGSLGRLKFRGYVEDPSLGLPGLVPPGDDYDLKYFETHDDSKQVLQLGIGMRWYFRPDRKLNPWLGAGWTAQWNPSYELELEYTHLSTGMETSDELVVPALQKPLSYAGFNLGLRYRFAEKWQLKLGGYYDFKASKQQGIPRWWGWQIGVAHRF